MGGELGVLVIMVGLGDKSWGEAFSAVELEEAKKKRKMAAVPCLITVLGAATTNHCQC